MKTNKKPKINWEQITLTPDQISKIVLETIWGEVKDYKEQKKMEQEKKRILGVG